MSIEVIETVCGEIESVKINGEKLESDDGDVWYCPKSFLGDATISELPKNLKLMICKYKEGDAIMLDTLPMYLQKSGASRVHIAFEDVVDKKHWDLPIEPTRLMETKKAIIEERSREIRDLNLDSYDEDEIYISMCFSANIATDSLINAVEQAELLIEEIDGAAKIALEFEPINFDARNESDFSLYVVLPILRKLGFTNVKYNHGNKENGKDFVFARISEFDELEHWGAQVKFGDVSGGTRSQIDELISQANLAFKMPFYSIYTRKRESISKFAIIISGKFTENAIEYVCDGIDNDALKNNIIFIDMDKIEVLKHKLFKSNQ